MFWLLPIPQGIDAIGDLMQDYTFDDIDSLKTFAKLPEYKTVNYLVSLNAQ